MTIFLRLLAEEDKGAALLDVCSRQRAEGSAGHPLIFEVAPEAFDAVPGKPFAYWVSDAVRESFRQHPAFQSCGRTAASGGKTLDDFRFVRTTWERSDTSQEDWRGFAKGGSFSPFYADIHLYLGWGNDAESLKTYLVEYRASRGWSPNWTAELHSNDYYFRPGLSWPARTNGLSFRVIPAGCIFGHKGPAAFVIEDDPNELLALACLLNSSAFGLLV